jgi:hypothetical protein
VFEALALKSAWISARGLTSSVIGDPDWEASLLSLTNSDSVQVARLSVGGATAAIEIGLVQDGHWRAFLGSHRGLPDSAPDTC